jgi:glc operon protein GlcG
MRVHNLVFATCVLAIAGATGVSSQSLTVQRTEISPYAAREIVAACAALAEEENMAVAIAVVDPHGTLLAFQAMEGVNETASTTAQLKAKTAARWRRSTDDIFERVNNHVNRAAEWMGGFPQGGGFPITVDGLVIGAAGGGGGGGDGSLDDRCTLHGIRMVFGQNVDVGLVDIER